MKFSSMDFALATVIGGDSQRAAHAGMALLDRNADSLGISNQRENFVQAQYSKDMGAANMSLAGMLAKMAFTIPADIQVGAGGGKSGEIVR